MPWAAINSNSINNIAAQVREIEHSGGCIRRPSRSWRAILPFLQLLSSLSLQLYGFSVQVYWG
jgi:hypothetical protein